MQVVDNRALLFTTRDHAQITALIPKSKVLEEHEGEAKLLVDWSFDSWRILRNLGVDDAPHPILGRYKWPGVYTPFDHQRTTAAFLASNPRCYCLSEPGTGKTSAAAWAADYLLTRNVIKRVLVICPLSIMDTAWRADLFRTVMHRSVAIATGSKRQREAVIQGDAEFVIINFDGVKVCTESLREAGFDLIIIDECFVAGTPVLTPQGQRPIEQLAAGDTVLTSSGEARIKRLVRRTSTALVEVRLSDGSKITCTPEHPFFTDAGWVTARNLTGRKLVSSSALRHMRNGVPNTDSKMGAGAPEGYPDRSSLLTILRTEEVPPPEPRSKLFQQHESGASRKVYRCSTVGGIQGPYISYTESQGAQAASSRGERHGYDSIGEAATGELTCGVGMELPSSVGREAARLSYELQARLRMAEVEDRVGSGWEYPYVSDAENTRSEERSETGYVRVESVSHIECSSPVPVFNLEIDGTPNYFVGDSYLVHNCTAIKSVSTDRWKALNSMVKPSTWVWAMTGTPAAQSPEDAYGIAKLVRPDTVPRYAASWRDRVMVKITQFKWIPKMNAQQVVYDTLQPAIRFTKEECLDLPDILYTTREVPLTKQQERYYNTIKQEMVALAAGEEITAANAAAMLNKLLQLSQGAVYTDTKEVIEFDIKPRLSELLDIIDGTTHKVLVFVPFRHVTERLKDELIQHFGDANMVEVIQGGVSATARSDTIKRFQTEDKPKVLLLAPQATAHGITLTRADNIVWWGPVSSTETYLQANARAHRAGQVNKVTVTHLQGSPVEKRMYAALQGKVDLHQSLVDMYKQEIA